MTYAVFGTLYNTFSIGITLLLSSNLFTIKPSAMEIFLFATLISAVDPVAVLCVFEEIHVNQLLYICVFGESLLNDAVTIVLYQTFSTMIEADKLTSLDYGKAGASFFIVSMGGILIGIIWALITGFTTKHSKHLNVVQPLICLLFPYLAYLTSELVAMSGILAIVMCGLLMKQFLAGNLSRKSLVTVQYFMKTLSSSCEALIFVYLGISAVSKNHVWDITFIAITIISCLAQRFVGVFFLTWLLNTKRVQKIDAVDQFIMSYGGLRGAVCYGLVMSLNEKVVTAKNMFASCTIAVILFTVFIQGTTIKWLVKLLKVKHNDEHKKTIFEMVGENALENVMFGIESITGHRGHYMFRNMFQRWNDLYVKPYLVSNAKSKATRLVDYNERIQVKEAVQHLKQHGSFAGLPTVQSKVSLNQTGGVTLQLPGMEGIQKDESGIEDFKKKDVRISMPRNESMSTFVQNKLKSIDSPVTRGVYSRHLLGIDNTPYQYSKIDQKNSILDAFENESYTKTYPYCMKVVRRKAHGQQEKEQYPKMNLERPRFIISDSKDGFLSPPNAPRELKNMEEELQGGLLMKKFTTSAINATDASKKTSDSEGVMQLGEKSNLLPVIEGDEDIETPLF